MRCWTRWSPRWDRNVRIGVLTAVHGRPFVTKLFYTAVDRLREQWAPHEVVCYVAGDDPVHRQIAKRFRAVWCEVPNNPLGAKFNVGALAALADGVDYLLMMGSDDLLSPVLAERYKQRLEQGVRYMGMTGLRFVDPVFSRAAQMLMFRSKHRRYEPVGPGRVLSHALLTELRGIPFFPLVRKGLDWNLHQQIEARTEIGSCVDLMASGDHQFVVDVKTHQNMWDFDHIASYGTAVEVPYRLTVREFPRAEQDMLYLIGQGVV